MQVIYATHSEHFVDPVHFTRIRRFQQHAAEGPAVSAITVASLEHVAERLDGVVRRHEIETRVRITLGRSLAEAVFARAALIVEGRTDAAFLHGLAERGIGLDGRGIAVVPIGGKSQLLLPWAVLEELGVPSYVIFDGDARLAERLISQGQAREEAERKLEQTRALNEVLLRVLGGDVDAQPETTVGARFACFRDGLETEYASWAGFDEERRGAADELADFRDKSEDAYRVAARHAPEPMPEVFVRLLDAIDALTRV